MSKKNQESEVVESNVVSEKKRLTPEQVEKQIAAIKIITDLTAQIRALLPEFEGKSVHKAYENSVLNLEKKNEQYVTARAPSMSDEEKELLRKFRAGELIIKEKKI